MADRGRLLYFGAALAAAAALVFVPVARRSQPPPPPTVAQAWPAVRRGTIPAELPDGTAYEPILFLDAEDSVGTAPSRDGGHLRLVHRAGGSIRELRRVPVSQNPLFGSPAVAADVLVWAESTRGGQQLWRAGLRAGGPARLLTADTGDPRFYQSQYDLVIAQGRVHWVAAAPDDGTEVRSVALAGGPVRVRVEPGSWALSAWPWLVDGMTNLAGTGRLRNVLTGRDRPVALTRRSMTACTPAWCRVQSRDDDGRRQIEIMRPDGSDRRRIAGDTAVPVIADVAVLDRFEVFARVTPASELTGRLELLAYDIATHRTVMISPEAAAVSYRGGVLCWSTGNRQSFLRHALDLRTA